MLDLLEHKPIISAGYKAVLHVHSLVEECEITDLRAEIDKKTMQQKKVGRPSAHQAWLDKSAATTWHEMHITCQQSEEQGGYTT